VNTESQISPIHPLLPALREVHIANSLLPRPMIPAIGSGRNPQETVIFPSIPAVYTAEDAGTCRKKQRIREAIFPKESLCTTSLKVRPFPAARIERQLCHIPQTKRQEPTGADMELQRFQLEPNPN
jgi:hypothetical protein